MLVIDNQLLNLARMQEAVLRKSINDKESNLEKYEDTVKEIDDEAFASMLSELEQINEHNQTLEDELQFLEQVKDSYNQLLELQLSFKRVCELFGDKNLKLSDLSQINIEYIENRINAINGYLINIKNLEINKNKLQELNVQLVDEEKKKRFFREKMLELEESLRKQFVGAEGRIIEDGNSVPTSVILEYKKLGYDFEKLLVDGEGFSNLFEKTREENDEMEDKLQIAEICYNSAPSKVSKQVYDEIMVEYLSFKYRLTMLKILELLIVDCDNYDVFKEKRDKILDLIKYRVSCLFKLGVRYSVDPFDRIKIAEQFDLMSSFVDNSNNINRIKREIIQVSERVDEMENQKNEYKIQLSNSEDLILSKISMNDIDVSTVSWDVADYFDEQHAALDNQVVDIREISSLFNIRRAMQKANLVVIRVNDMHNQSLLKDNKVREEDIPELVIVPKSTFTDSEEFVNDEDEDLSVSFEEEQEELDNPLFEEKDGSSLAVDDDEEELSESENVDFDDYSSDIFETVIPFETTPMFTDRTDDSLESEIEEVGDSLSSKELEVIANKKEVDLDLHYSIDTEDEMPDAFWVTQEDGVVDESDNLEPSFDDQISALLNENNDEFEDDNNEVKVKKIEFARKDNLKRVA